MNKNIFLIGFMGAGKTKIGKILSKKLNYNFLDSDEAIENNEKMTITELFNLKGENYFRNLETEFIKNFLNITINNNINMNNKHTVIATGGGMPCCNDNIKLLKNKGTVVYLKTRPETVYERIKEERHRPVLGQTGFSISEIENLLEKREQFYCKADLTIYTDGISPEGTAEEIKIFLNDMFR
ncbi:MAG: shikimate kinase [Candidatus Acididesulfobacter diazotrophicus]|jgi:shikimate kinase|uniref:Shikimate kinase n=1 Tax=Candidatus Acididesulfobacter diazotrophicus TaxID=2597226 RepID=A0A519BPT0_9DELT|nr:MAG: shikimate kinase [Candidatus Acididesulfobacter diazotrophicus]